MLLLLLLFNLCHHQVANNEDFWQWMRASLIPAMYAKSWYNGMRENITIYNGDKHSILVGIPRARQLRIKEGKWSDHLN